MITKLKTKKVQKEKKPKSKMYSNKIKEILRESGMTQQELADIVETNPAHLSRIINGQRQCISLPIAMKIAKALKYSVEDIFQSSKQLKSKQIKSV
jgi:DNA-binding XRE family transcriptional regulator